MSTDKYNELKYKRGFLLTDRQVDAPHAHWKYLSIDKYHFYYDPLNDVLFKDTADNWVLLFGNIIDIRSETMEKQFIASEALRLLEVSEIAFFDYLDELSGRYLIFYGNKNTAKILSDAAGLRSIFYSTEQTVIASHSDLVNEVTNSGESTKVDREWLKTYSSSLIPGHFTYYHNIYFLTPNTLLEVNTTNVRRFFPREDIEIKPMEQIVEEITALSKKQMELLSKSHKTFLFSLTGGIDSRTTLALAKDFKDKCHFFTYRKENFNSSKLNAFIIDESIVKEMTYNLDLNHEFLTIDYNLKDQDFIDFTNVMNRNITIQHNLRLAKLYLDSFPSNLIHIRSNVYEIGTMSYRRRFKLPKTPTVESLVLIYSKEAKDDQRVYDAFKQFYETIQLDQIHNYDAFDLLYWEYRMGTWHSQIISESDVAHDTFVLINVRKIIKLLLSVPLSEKQDKTVLKELINKNWPILNYWEVNSLGNPTAHYDKQFDDVGIPLTAAKFQSGSIDGQRIVPIRKKVQTRRMKFCLEESSPLEGDFVEAVIPLKTEANKSSHCILHLRSPYENIKLKGRIKYQIFLNNRLLLEEDVACWRETNQISLKWKKASGKDKLKIKVLSMRDCEDWAWGKAGTILVEKIILRNGDKIEEDQLQVSATSPFSVIQK
ncbi:hypothetical protein [Neobacillus niacini]|uniref:hypothetical protein n=1 Tax=Neobacillus niacini TaxID=86668 RepID=UPI001C8EA546|nr:hypothetical protein [Neobacillus niacini]MBY0145142.1 hypothetical protein [Neobacillus niacini]